MPPVGLQVLFCVLMRQRYQVLISASVTRTSSQVLNDHIGCRATWCLCNKKDVVKPIVIRKLPVVTYSTQSDVPVLVLISASDKAACRSAVSHIVSFCYTKQG